MYTQPAATKLITLTQAAKIAPGRPSTNCLWRWCRRGVLSRGGERVRLEHRRVVGKIYTAPQWLDDFGRRLAEADSRHFDQREAAVAEPGVGERQAARHDFKPETRSRSTRLDIDRVEDAERELDKVGIQ